MRSSALINYDPPTGTYFMRKVMVVLSPCLLRGMPQSMSRLKRSSIQHSDAGASAENRSSFKRHEPYVALAKEHALKPM